MPYFNNTSYFKPYSLEEVNETGVYAIVNTTNDRMYIGSAATSFRLRWNKHRYQLNRGTHHCLPLQNAWNKYGEASFKLVILEVVPKSEWTDKKYLLDVELGYFCSGYNLYNIAVPSHSNLGWKPSDEVIDKRREAFRLKKEQGWKKVISPEGLEGIKRGNLSRRGRTTPEETRKKMSDSQKARNHGKTYTMVSPEGEVITFINMAQFCLDNNIESYSSFWNAAVGNTKSYKGWTRYAV